MKMTLEERVLELIRTRGCPGLSGTAFLRLGKIEKAQVLYDLVYSSRFELISHFIAGPFSNGIKSGEEFVYGLGSGFGGVCLERVLALKLLLERFDICECKYAIGGSLPGANLPMDEKKVFETLNNGHRMGHSIYAHHAAVIARINNDKWLLDPNAGRFGRIFLGPSLTESMLDSDPKAKFGMQASFGQMFYHSATDELFDAVVKANRQGPYFTMDVICKVGVLVGSNFDVFAMPKKELEDSLPRLFPRRVQTFCWQFEGGIVETLTKRGLHLDRYPNDIFLDELDNGYKKMLSLSETPKGKGPLQLVLRIAEKNWAELTQPGPPLSEDLLMS